jgi:hypothetical protein
VKEKLTTTLHIIIGGGFYIVSLRLTSSPPHHPLFSGFSSFHEKVAPAHLTQRIRREQGWKIYKSGQQ